MHRPTKSSMSSRTLIGLTVAGLLTASCAALQAAELNPKHVPADAKWIIHVDYDAMSDSALWQKLRTESFTSKSKQAAGEHQGKGQIGQMIQGWMKERYGIDLPEDLKSITMFSQDYKAYTGTVIVQANYSADKIESRLKEAPNHRTTKWQDLTLHTITLSKQKDDGPSGDQEMTVVLVDDSTLMLASSVDNAKEMLKLLQGDGQTLANQESQLLNNRAKNAWIYGAAIDLQELEQHPAAMPILTQHQRIHWSFGKQADGSLYEQAELVAQSSDVAQKMKKVVDGVIAYQSLWADDSQALNTLVDNTQVKTSGNTTSFMWQGSQEQVVAAVEDLFTRLNGA